MSLLCGSFLRLKLLWSFMQSVSEEGLRKFGKNLACFQTMGYDRDICPEMDRIEWRKQMDFLRVLEGIRNPVLDAFWSAVTHFGEETLFLVIGMVIYWCVSKQAGRYLIGVGIVATIFNQFLKLLFRIPRPWVLDEQFTIVESARAGAGGYSFPSGHTQIAVGVYGGIALWTKKRWLRAVMIALAVLVPISRMYLGVHTPLDTGVAAATSVLILLALYPPMAGKKANMKSTRAVYLIMLILALAYCAYVSFCKFPEDIDMDNLQEGTKNAWLLLGAAAGMWVSLELDERRIHFDTQAAPWVQVVKTVLGLALVMGVRAGLKVVLQPIFHGAPAADAVRYFLVVLTGAAIWTMTFRSLARLGTKEQKA